MGSGGIGFTIGSSKSTHDLREKGTTQSQSFSTVGSTGGALILPPVISCMSAARTWWLAKIWRSPETA